MLPCFPRTRSSRNISIHAAFRFPLGLEVGVWVQASADLNFHARIVPPEQRQTGAVPDAGLRYSHYVYLSQSSTPCITLTNN